MTLTENRPTLSAHLKGMLMIDAADDAVVDDAALTATRVRRAPEPGWPKTFTGETVHVDDADIVAVPEGRAVRAAWVREWKAAIRDGADIPPGVVVALNGQWTVVDGVHRLVACRELGWPFVAQVWR